MRIAIIGAGMAGLACAEAMRDHGCGIALFDKGRLPGGRMSTKLVMTELGDVGFDYGAQYLSARQPSFKARVELWREAGIVAPWTEAGADAWVGTPGMSAPLIEMAARLNVNWSSRIASIAAKDKLWRLIGNGIDFGPFNSVVVAVPAEQVTALVGDHDQIMAASAAATPSTPCWTVMAVFAEPLPTQIDIIRDRRNIIWAARNSAKPSRTSPEAWVIQSGPEWSVEHLEDDSQTIANSLLSSLADVLGFKIPEPMTKATHRWRYAKSGHSDLRCLWNNELKLGLCGDWLIGPKIEAAWLSGSALAQKIVASF